MQDLVVIVQALKMCLDQLLMMRILVDDDDAAWLDAAWLKSNCHCKQLLGLVLVVVPGLLIALSMYLLTCRSKA